MVLVVLAASSACSVAVAPGENAAALEERAIYGTDERVEALLHPDAELVHAAGELVGALIPRAFAKQEAGGFAFSGPTLGERVALCPGEAGLELPSLSVCTALLAPGNTIVSAGHCFSLLEPHELLFVRGYLLGDGFPWVASERVSEIASVLAVVDGELESDPSADMAVARLRARGTLPSVAFPETTSDVAPGDPVAAVGTSEGLPLQISPGSVLATFPDHFEVTTDTFQGGSGSPVFSAERRFLGLLVGGPPDYAWSDERGCFERIRRELPVERAEMIVRAERLAELVANAPAPSSPPPLQRETNCSASVRSGPSARNGVALVFLAWGIRRRSRARRRE